ncbi:glutamate ABC transporter substrate-binding protein [Aeromicrobium terrae]|uniref:Glutamate ABC transporter substrate-binding protein n=1 Tax=Aeromicrobium terrae TaxID=2498846 RepID=A0A5C8NQW4_9ACTN|nr:glutamate ABC transporter substrate-binding protein [Aeromicrobium terrae]TXL63265.1 glutamate ABC transporter substrate-binding protein [Aeromicrobium terrae]
MKRTRLAVIAAAAALVLAACGSAGEDDSNPVDNDVAKDAASQFEDGTAMKALAESGKVKIGVKFDQPGLGFKKAGVDIPTGFDVEIGKIIAAKLGIKPSDVDWIETISDNREPFLQKGTVDFVIASYSITDDRRKVVGQAGPYYVTGQQLLVKKGSNIKSVDDIKGKDVCSVTGSTSLAQVEAKGAKVKGFETYSQCRDQVLDGSIDSMTTDGSILLGYAAENPDELEVVGDPFSTENYGVGYSKDKPELCQFIVDTIKEAEDNGDWAKAFEATLGKSGVETPEPPKMDPCP